jgi:rhodanese-related sulfurtransferase
VQIEIEESEAPEGALFIDIREAYELELEPTPPHLRSIWVPMGEVTQRLADLPAATAYVLVCHHGVRSAMLAYALHNLGRANFFSLIGGTAAMSSGASHD